MPTYQIVPERSMVWIDAKSSLHPIEGEATGMAGTIEVDLVDGQLRLTDARLELPVSELNSGNPLYDRELLRRLDARRFPRIRGEVREVSPGGRPGRYKVRGELTCRGVSRLIDGEVSVRAPNDRSVQVEGEQVFDIREFGIEPPRLLGLRVHPDVRVRIQLVAESTA